MDNRAFDKTKLPSRHVTERTSRALLRSYFHAMGLRGEPIHLMRQAQAFKRGVATGVTVAGRTVNENLSKVVSNGDHGPPNRGCGIRKKKKRLETP